MDALEMGDQGARSSLDFHLHGAVGQVLDPSTRCRSCARLWLVQRNPTPCTSPLNSSAKRSTVVHASARRPSSSRRPSSHGLKRPALFTSVSERPVARENSRACPIIFSKSPIAASLLVCGERHTHRAPCLIHKREGCERHLMEMREHPKGTQGASAKGVPACVAPTAR